LKPFVFATIEDLVLRYDHRAQVTADAELVGEQRGAEAASARRHRIDSPLAEGRGSRPSALPGQRSRSMPSRLSGANIRRESGRKDPERGESALGRCPYRGTWREGVAGPDNDRVRH